MYSFTKPRPKSMVHQDTKVWILLILIMFAFLLSLLLFIEQEKRNIKVLIEENRNKKLEYTDKIITKKDKLKQLKEQLNAIEIVYQENLSKKDSIKNLFELIPSGMRLTYTYLDNKKLILKGFVNTKDTYYYKLAIYLRSIFYKSSVEFTKINNDLYSFNSISLYEQSKNKGIEDKYEQSSKSKIIDIENKDKNFRNLK